MAGAVACERFLQDNKQALELIEQAVALAPDSELAGDELLETKLRLKRKSSIGKASTRH